MHLRVNIGDELQTFHFRQPWLQCQALHPSTASNVRVIERDINSAEFRTLGRTDHCIWIALGPVDPHAVNVQAQILDNRMVPPMNPIIQLTECIAKGFICCSRNCLHACLSRRFGFQHVAFFVLMQKLCHCFQSLAFLSRLSS